MRLDPMSCALEEAAPVASVSVVICCYSEDRWDNICASIGSALEQSLAPDQIVVVVDHNAALKLRLEKAFPQVLVIDNRYARGLSGARNSGVEAATGSLVAFLDDDAVADPEMLRRMRTRLLDATVLGVGAQIVPRWSGRAPNWFPREFLWVVGCSYQGLKAGPVRNLIGAAMCMRRSLFTKVGGFSEGVGRGELAYPLGCEETELCIRAGIAFPGKSFVYEPSATCGHAVSSARATWRYFMVRCHAEGRSKAQIQALLPPGKSLGVEKSYVLKTLSGGFARGIANCAAGRDPTGVVKSAAIAVGLACTVAGYAQERLSVRLRPSLTPGTRSAA